MLDALKADFKHASGLALLTIVALAAWLSFQWGFGNDALLPSVAANAFDWVDDRQTWPAGLAAVGVASLSAFGFWGITQAIDVVVVMTSADRIPRTMAVISERVRKRNWVKPYAELSWPARIGIAYAVGASVLCLVDVLATGQPGLRRRLDIAATSVFMSAASIATVVGLITAVAMVGTRVSSVQDEADVLIRYAKNPLTWLVIFATIFAANHIWKRINKVGT